MAFCGLSCVRSVVGLAALASEAAVAAKTEIRSVMALDVRFIFIFFGWFRAIVQNHSHYVETKKCCREPRCHSQASFTLRMAAWRRRRVPIGARRMFFPMCLNKRGAIPTDRSEALVGYESW